MLVGVAAALLIVESDGTTIAIGNGWIRRGPRSKPLPSAIHEGLAASKPAGVTARIRFTNGLFPSGALLGQVGSALMSGASGRLWMRDDGRGRLELQSNAGDVQIVWKRGQATVYDASSNTVYRIKLPAGQRQARHAPPSVAGIGAFLAELTKHANVSSAKPSNVGGRPAYTVQLSPKEAGGLLGSVRLAWDAAHGVPLRAAIYARGGTKPVLALQATSISTGRCRSRRRDRAAGGREGRRPRRALGPGEQGKSRIPDKASRSRSSRPTRSPASSTAVGRRVGHGASTAAGPRSSSTAKGSARSWSRAQGRLGLGSRSAQGAADAFRSTASTGHELATPLATILSWDRGGVTYVLAGSVKPSVAESAARSLR